MEASSTAGGSDGDCACGAGFTKCSICRLREIIKGHIGWAPSYENLVLVSHSASLSLITSLGLLHGLFFGFVVGQRVADVVELNGGVRAEFVVQPEFGFVLHQILAFTRTQF